MDKYLEMKRLDETLKAAKAVSKELENYENSEGFKRKIEETNQLYSVFILIGFLLTLPFMVGLLCFFLPI